MEWTLAEVAAHPVLDLVGRCLRDGVGLERRRRGSVVGVAFGCPREAEATFLLARHRSAFPSGRGSPAHSGAGRMGSSWCSRLRGSAPVVPRMVGGGTGWSGTDRRAAVS